MYILTFEHYDGGQTDVMAVSTSVGQLIVKAEDCSDNLEWRDYSEGGFVCHEAECFDDDLEGCYSIRDIEVV